MFKQFKDEGKEINANFEEGDLQASDGTTEKTIEDSSTHLTKESTEASVTAEDGRS